MGNGASFLQLKAGAAACSARKWDVAELGAARERFGNVDADQAARMQMTLESFVQVFPKLGSREAVRLFRPFSERDSVRTRANSHQRKACAFTIFTGLCVLCRASLREKCRFLFGLFDLDGSSALSADECVVLLTCVLRATATLGETVPRLLQATPDELDELVREPFQELGTRYLTWEAFYPWAAEFVSRFLVDQVESIASPVSPARRKRPPPGKRGEQHDADGEEHRSGRFRVQVISGGLSSHSGAGSPEVVSSRAPECNQRGDLSDSDVPQQDGRRCSMAAWQDSPPEHEHSVEGKDGDEGGRNSAADADDCWRPQPSFELEGPGDDNDNELCSGDAAAQVLVEEPFDGAGVDEQASGALDAGAGADDAAAMAAAAATAASGTAAADDGDFLEADQAVEQILCCLAEIDDGDLTSLPWILDALRLLAEHDGCQTLQTIVPNVLPLVCNVAACDDPTLACEALNVLSLIFEGAPDRIRDTTDTVNERALMEMCLVRALDEDTLVACAAKACLFRVAETQPYGFGRTLAALLEAGTLHESPGVVLQCAAVIDQVVDHIPDDIEADLDGRVTLLVSALCLWAHGESEECKRAAKVIVVKLSLRFAGQPEWEAAIEGSDSVLLQVWNKGLDPSPEEAREMEREHEQRKRQEQVMEEHAAADPSLSDEYRIAAAERGWVIPGGSVAFACDPREACMFPQVFAVLGFRGPGGLAVGVPAQSAFDQRGTFRRREVVTETRTVEFTKVLWNGKVQRWEEREESTKETTHLENAEGHFARREKVHLRRHEKMCGGLVAKEVDRRDFVHFRNEVGEVSTYVDCASPTSPQIASPVAPGAGGGFGGFGGGLAADAAAKVAGVSLGGSGSDAFPEDAPAVETVTTYEVEEPASP